MALNENALEAHTRRPAVEHVAIDLGGRESQICVRDEKGALLQEQRMPTDRLAAWLKGRPGSRVVIETCAEAFGVADAVLELGHEVRVVPATLVRSLGVGHRGVKNDRRDAQILSEVSARIDLPSVHIPSATSRQRKTLCAMREALVGCRTKLVNTVRGWLRAERSRVHSGAVETFPARVREHFSAGQRADQADGLPSYVERQLRSIEQLTTEIREADRELSRMASADPICQRLMSTPGVGPVTALRYVAALDEQARFPSAHQVESYIGLTPGDDSSSERQRRTSITKAGAPKLRWALTQAAWSMRRCARNDPMVLWCLQVEKRRGKKVATVALARKLAGVLFALWRDGTTYDPRRAAAQPPSEET